jgi:protein ATS1
MSFTLLAGDPATGEYMIMGPPEKPVMTTAPTDIKNWKTIGATWRGVVVLFQDGTLTGWGQTFKFRLVPENLPLLQQIAVGTEHVVAVTNHDNVIAWGWNEHGNCGADEGTKYFDNSWNMITGYKGTVDFIAAGWATTFIVTRERDDRSVGAVLCKVGSSAKQDTGRSEDLADEEPHQTVEP